MIKAGTAMAVPAFLFAESVYNKTIKIRKKGATDMKKLLAMLCAAGMLVSLAACGSKEAPDEDVSVQPQPGMSQEVGGAVEPDLSAEPQEPVEPERPADQFDPTKTAYGYGKFIITVNDVDASEYAMIIFEDGQLTFHDFGNNRDGKGSYSYLGLDLPTEESPYYGMVPEQVMLELDARDLEYTIDVYEGESMRP